MRASQISILEHIAYHRRLTYDHLGLLGVSTSKNYLYQMTAPLMEKHRDFIKAIKQEPDPTYGQSPDLLTLTTKGKKRLVKNRGRNKDDILLTG